MKTRTALLCCLALVLMNQNAAASMIHGVVVDAPGSYVDFPNDASGAPDHFMVQINDGSYITLDFGSLLTTSGVLSIFTWDNDYPASAQIDLSTNGTTFFNLTPSLSDVQGPIGPPYPHADFVVTTPFRYVRVTDIDDHGVLIDGQPVNLDLNAVGFEASTVAVPEPTSMALLGLGTFAFAVSRRIARRRKDAE
jgi:hypothetical protein